MSSAWKSENWIAASWDKLERGRQIQFGIERWIFRERSEFQEVAIATVPDYGKGLFLDAVVEFLAIDEFIYHESFALPPLLFHPSPKRVLIEGGGDGLALREVLRDPRVEEVVMVELDGLVIDACKEHLGDLHRGSFDDPRATILVQDIFPYLEEGPEPFDVILVDLLDAYNELAVQLYAKVLGLTAKALAPGGIVGGFGDLARPLFSIAPTYDGLSDLFRNLVLHRATVQTFSSEYGFLMASNDLSFAEVSSAEIEKRASGLRGELRALTPAAFPGCFAVPRYIAEALSAKRYVPIKSLGDVYSWTNCD